MTTEITNNIEELEFKDILSEKYLAYALSTIMSRSLPDVRDGLKPVHRRLLFAMRELKLSPNTGFKKCARIVGDVIGKYHPHGDVAVYDTLVRLAQNFTIRYPLIDGQGNFGSIDGDNAAAMRYTESRLTSIALELMSDLDENTVDFKANYDESEKEPSILPASFPNILANGSEGIAVGMATSIPPHNLHELCDALLHLIEKKDSTPAELMQFVHGPDFPTGGTIIDSKEVIAKIYETGKGSLRVRAKWEKQELSHGMYQIVISELPFQVQKSKLIEKIAELLKDKKLPLLANLRDESTEDVRIILEPKNRSCDANILMESLFKLTSLENRVNINLNMLDRNSVPRVMNLSEILVEFLEHKNDVVVRRTKHRLQKIEHRIEILEGFIIAYLNLDEIIHIIRTEEKPKDVLMAKFSLTEVQTEAILNMRLRSLAKLEEITIKKDHDAACKERDELKEILDNPRKLKSLIKKEIKNIQKLYGYKTEIGDRRTQFNEIATSAEIIDIEAFIEKEPITIFCSKMGWIRAVKGHVEDDNNAKYKDNDELKFMLHAQTTDKILIFSSSGKFFTIIADQIHKGKGYGEAVSLMFDMDDKEQIVNIISYKANSKFLVASSSGKGFIVNSNDVIAQTKNGKQILNITNNNLALICKEMTAEKIAVIGTNRKLLIFDSSEIPEMKRGQGVTLQKYKDAKLADVKFFKEEDGLTWQLGSKIRTEQQIIGWLGKRGAVGKLPPTGFPKNNKFN